MADKITSPFDYGMPGIKNWRGQQVHPIDNFLWFQSDDKERDKAIAQYDAFCQGDKEKAKMLDDLISDMRATAVIEYEFSNSEDA